CPLRARPPRGSGSGKSLSPRARMHRAYFSSCPRSGPLPPRVRSAGISDLQAAYADAYWGEFAPMTPPPGPALTWMPPLAPGSGKSGRPCERMHRAKATGSAIGAAVAGVELPDGPALATAGPGELAEQAAAVAATAMAKVIEARRFMKVPSLTGWVKL